MSVRLKQLHFGAEVTLNGHSGLEVTARGKVRPADDNDPGSAEFLAEQGKAPGPETLLTTAHAVCFISALVSVLEQEGHEPSRLTVRSVCTMSPREDQASYRISRVRLWVDGSADGVDARDLRRLAEEAEDVCPISGAIGDATPIDLSLAS